MFSVKDITAAAKTIAGIADATPFVPSPYMTALVGQDVFLKLENMQPIGAFKLRGAVNAIAQLPDGVKGVTCCSTGNHGRGVAYAAAKRGIRAVICMSELVPQTKVDGIRALGAEVRIVGQSQDDALVEAQRLVEEEGLVEISPFDDPQVIAGQGTIGLEMMAQKPDLTTILVPLSGGGLAAGIGVGVKAVNPDVRVIGVTMDRGAAMHAAIKAGHPVDVVEVPSLADSLGGGIGQDNKLSFPLCQQVLDDIILVSEDDIRDAMQMLYFEDRIIAEGASVVGLAAMISGKFVPSRGSVATVVTGRNVDMAMFTQIMNGGDIVLGDKVVMGRPYGA